MTVRYTYDPNVGAWYIQLSDKPAATTVSLSDHVIVDFSIDGQPRGVEVLEVGRGAAVRPSKPRNPTDRAQHAQQPQNETEAM